MERMGYSVVNVGERDIRLGYETFATRTEGSGLRFISANVVDKATQQPIFEPYTIVEAAAPDGSRKVRVGLIGVMRFNPVFLKPGPEGKEMVVAHPLTRIREVLEQMKPEKVDLVVLLAALHRDDAVRMIRDVPGIDFVVGSYGGILATQQEETQKTWVLYAGNQGKRLGSTRVYLAPGGAVRDQATKIHNLTQIYPHNAEMLAFVNAIPREKKPEPAPQAHATTPSAADYLGSAQCGRCHEGAYAQWEQTPHAKAMDTLAADGKQNDASCSRCHVTGAGRPGGFVTLQQTPHLSGVGCESCHGPGRKHVNDPRADYGAVALANCTGCHDFRNSPKFDYYAYLPRVRHAAAGVAAGPAE